MDGSPVKKGDKLKTSTEINVKFYKRFGFEVMKAGIIPETDVEQWYLLRNAK